MVGYFQEAEGVNSITRVNTSLLVWAGLLISLVTVFAPLLGVKMNIGENYTFAITLIATGLGGKLVQKFGEGKNGKK